MEAIKDIVKDFEVTRLYTDEFIADLEAGLNQASLAKSIEPK